MRRVGEQGKSIANSSQKQKINQNNNKMIESHLESEDENQ